MFGELLAGAIAGGLGGVIGSLFSDDDKDNMPIPFCDLPAKITHWQYLEDEWGCMITVWALPEWFIQQYVDKQMTITVFPVDPTSGAYLKSKKSKDGKISDPVLPMLIYTVQKKASYSVFIPYSEVNTDNLERIQCNIVVLVDDKLVLRTTLCFSWNIPSPNRVETLQQAALVYYAKIMDELFDFENDRWGNEYDELIEAVFHFKDTDDADNRAIRSYLEACFFDGIPADYEIAAALDTSEEAEREDIFEAVFQFYTFMQNTVSSIVSNSTVISDIARSLGISNESYCRITGATSKEKQNPKDRVLRSEIRNANYKKWA